jgi:hypothetical protein
MINSNCGCDAVVQGAHPGMTVLEFTYLIGGAYWMPPALHN